MAKPPVANQVPHLDQAMLQGTSGETSPSRVAAVKQQAVAIQASGTKMLETGVKKAGDIAALAKQRTAEAAALAMQKTTAAAADRGVQVGVASAVGGGMVVGAGGAATGFAAGGLAGAAAGLVPALFTFGLSIPIGAAIGAGCGAVAGGAIGGTVGFTGAGAAGYGAYTKRVGIMSAIASARATLLAAFDRTYTMSKLFAAKTKKNVVDATGAAVALGTAGAATGAVAGVTLGAAAGLLPALLIFGLSIQVFVIVGGGCGLVAGSTLGGATWAVAEAGGYQAYTRREASQAYAGKTSQQVSAGIEAMSQHVRGKLDSAMSMDIKKKS